MTAQSHGDLGRGGARRRPGSVGVLADRMAAALVHHEPGWRLPRLTALARRYNVSAAEADAALEELAARHLVRRLPDGQVYRASPSVYHVPLEGVFGLASLVDPMGGQLACKSRTSSVRHLPDEIRSALSLDSDEHAVAVRCLWTVGGEPGALSVTYLPERLAGALADDLSLPGETESGAEDAIVVSGLGQDAGLGTEELPGHAGNTSMAAAAAPVPGSGSGDEAEGDEAEEDDGAEFAFTYRPARTGFGSAEPCDARPSAVPVGSVPVGRVPTSRVPAGGTQAGSVQGGSVQGGSAQPGSAQAGSAQPGTERPGTADPRMPPSGMGHPGSTLFPWLPSAGGKLQPHALQVEMGLPPPAAARNLRIPASKLVAMVTMTISDSVTCSPVGITVAMLRPELFRIVFEIVASPVRAGGIDGLATAWTHAMADWEP